MNPLFIRLRYALFAAILLGICLAPLSAGAVMHRHSEDGDTGDAAESGDDDSGNKEDMDSGDSDKSEAADKADAGDNDDNNKDDANKDDANNDDADEQKSAPEPAEAPAKRAKAHAAAETPLEAPAKAPEPAPPPPPVRSGGWWRPKPGTTWQIQYSGKLDISRDVAAYDLDLVDTDEAVFKSLHERGIKVICYFSAGSWEAWRPDARAFPKSVLGKPNGWKNEQWLDIRKLDILKPIMSARIDLAAQKGCDAVDPDNVEGYDNKSGFPLTAHDQIVYNTMIADLAHALGMAVGLKNDVDQAEKLAGKFDFQVNEQCFEYKTCNDLKPFVAAGKPVFNIEYNVESSKFCPKANAMNFDSLQKKLELDAWVKACR